MRYTQSSTTFSLPFLSLLALLMLPGCASSRSDTAANPISKADAARLQADADKVKTDADKAKEKGDKDKEPQVLVKARPLCPIRLGGVFLRGLGDSPDPQEDSANAGTKLSDASREWLAANCDVAALNTVNLQPDTFRKITGARPLFTPLIYAYASSLYEQDAHRGSVGGWQASMTDWTLRDAHDMETPHPDKGGHWMDFGNEAWAAHWRDQVAQSVTQFGAQGVVASELPPGNTYVPDKLQKYNNASDRLAATSRWLRTAHAPGRFLLIPSAIGFDSLAGHSTLPVSGPALEPELSGRVWDEFFPLTDGAWAEGWVTPYWSGKPLPDAQWELHVEAADRAARMDQVFIACAAYHNDDELEYVLASFLMACHAQGRFCLQPMPLRPGQPADAGYSLAAFRKEVTAKADFFNPTLGRPTQERHPIRVDGGDVWRRQFQGGDAYVNSDDNRTKTLHFSGKMRRLNGKVIRQLVMPPHSGAILQYMAQ